MISHSLKETEAIARQALSLIEPHSGAAVLALYGDLGSGKTTFTQFLSQALGIRDYVTSPTFVIEKKYDLPAGKFSRLIHIDCYRLSGAKDMLALDWTEISADRANLIVIEWPERIEEVLPERTVRIKFEYAGENERKIIIKGQ